MMPHFQRSGARAKTAENSATVPADLFTELRTLRKKLADERSIPPYMIFGDRTLKEMCQYFPKDKDELSKIFGVGAQKLAQFGAAFLEVIRNYQ